jgi:1,4-dihydroxy-2-naphthoate octaprenyltransferase
LQNPPTSRWQALNPAIYLISILPGLTVALLANQPSYWLYGLFLATIAVALLQHSINVLNDLSDWRLGADVNKMDSWVRFHQLNLRVVAAHGAISFLLGALAGLYVLHISSQYWILVIALPLVFLGYLYNSGEKPLSYSWAGEWVTAVCYGPGVFGCLWLVSGQTADYNYVLGSVAFAALSASLLLSHQPPQIDTDRQAGKHSFAVRFGADTTYRVSRLLFVISWLCLFTGLLFSSLTYWLAFSYAVLCLLASTLVYRVKPQPKIILLSSAAGIIASLMISLLY